MASELRISRVGISGSLTVLMMIGTATMAQDHSCVVMKASEETAEDTLARNRCINEWWEHATVTDVESFLENYDVNTRYRSDFTPLHKTIIFGSKAATMAVISAGADVNARSNKGQTPLHEAPRTDDPEIVSALLKAGADVHARTTRGETPLWRAAWRESEAIIKLLLDAGADPNAADESGLSVLHVAAKYSTPEVVRTLLEAGADATAVNQEGATAFQLAEDNEKLKGTETYWQLNDASFK